MKNNEQIKESSGRILFTLAMGGMAALIMYPFATVFSGGKSSEAQEARVEAEIPTPEQVNSEAMEPPAREQARPAKTAAADSPLRDIKISFKLDPRITRGLYMGDRWVSPPTFTRVGEPQGCILEAKVQGVDVNGKPVSIRSEWSSANPDIVSVAPGAGNEVKIRVHRAGQCTLEVASLGISKTLPINAVLEHNAIRAEISQP